MAHHDIEFVLPSSFGMVQSWTYSTQITRTQSGSDQRVGKWAELLYGATLVYNNARPADLFYLVNWFGALGGEEDSFLIALPLDRDTAQSPGAAVTFDDVVLGTGDGATTTFQLRKGYTFGGTVTRYRQIRKPRSGTVLCSVNGVQTTAFSVDLTTGVVTFDTAPPASQTVAAGCEFLVAMRINGASLQAAIPNKVPGLGLMVNSTIALVEDRTA